MAVAGEDEKKMAAAGEDDLPDFDEEPLDEPKETTKDEKKEGEAK